MAPVAFQRYAAEFLQAAHDLRVDNNYSLVPAFLVCRSLELGLKAFCLAKGDKQTDFKKRDGVGHSLVAAFHRANRHGLSSFVVLSWEEEAELTKADKFYSTKGFEYLTPDMLYQMVTGHQGLPDFQTLTRAAERLVPAIAGVCRDAC